MSKYEFCLLFEFTSGKLLIYSEYVPMKIAKQESKNRKLIHLIFHVLCICVLSYCNRQELKEKHLGLLKITMDRSEKKSDIQF